MTELTRKKQSGAAWETVVADGGGGGSQDLAQVLAQGGDPDGNPITGPLEVSPADPNDNALTINLAAGAVAAGAAGLDIESLEGGSAFIVDFLDGVTLKDGDGQTTFQASPEGNVTIEPSNATTALVITSQADPGNGTALEVGPVGGLAFGVGDWDEVHSYVQLQAQATGRLGVFGASPVTRPVVPLTTPDVQDVIDALVLLGLVEQSDG